MHSSYHLVKGLIGTKMVSEKFCNLACQQANMVSDMGFQTIKPTREDKDREKNLGCAG